MTILGFDTSTAATAACLLRDDGEAFEALPPPERLGGPPGHASELLPALARVLDEAGAGWRDLDAIAVGVGPGTFTGLRIGVATARGLAAAHGLELRPVSSLRALAEGIEAPVRLPLIDAKRGELFAALYHDGDEEWPPLALRPEDLIGRLPPSPPRGEGLTPSPGGYLAPLAAGDGAVRFRHVLEVAGIGVAPDDSPAHVVRGLHVCRLAARAPGTSPEAVLPDYVRAPDAKPQ